MTGLRSVILFCLLLTVTVSSESQAAAAVDDISGKVHPFFHYSNYGGYFYVENEKLMILEAVFDDSKENIKPAFVCYVHKTIKTEIIVKERIINKETTFYFTDYSPSFIKIDSLEVFEKVIGPKLSKTPDGSGKITIKYKDNDLMLYYDNGKRINSNAALILDKKQKKVKIIDEEADYIWHELIDKYLLIALISQGGSGHTIYLNIYNLEDILKLIY